MRKRHAPAQGATATTGSANDQWKEDGRDDAAGCGEVGGGHDVIQSERGGKGKGNFCVWWYIRANSQHQKNLFEFVFDNGRNNRTIVEWI